MLLPARTKPAASHQVSAVHTRCHCWERSARAVPVLVVPGDFLPGGEVLHSPVALGMKCWAMTPFRLHPEQAGEQTSLPFAPECWDGLCSRVRAGRVALQAACWPGACFPSHTQLSENSAFCGCGTSARTWVLSCSPAAGVMEVPGEAGCCWRVSAPSWASQSLFRCFWLKLSLTVLAGMGASLPPAQLAQSIP